MSASVDFVHLHVHSEYSLLDGASKLKEIIDKVKRLNMNAVALTDHGNMYGAVKFYLSSKEIGIKPIIGCEMYLAPRTRFDKETKEDRSPYHLTVLAKDDIGYKNLISLVTLSHLEGFYQKPRIDRELLEKHKDGLIVLSGCLAGQIPSLILENKYSEAKNVAKWFKEIFNDDFYLELMDNGIPEQIAVTKKLLQLSKELDIPIVATNDTHYTNKEDAQAQDILMCIGMNKTIDDETRMKFYGEEFYLKSAEEMQKIFGEIPDAIENTVKISEKCNFQLQTNSLHFPDFPVPERHTHMSYLRELVENGLIKKYGQNCSKEVRERVDYELSIIEKMGYAPFFLVVQDFINYAKSKGIEVGPGRGSAAGSIVAYLIGITEIDPLKFSLLFERFLNIERVTMPDIDTDFCYERRQEVIDYVSNKYGPDHVAQIITFGTMAARGVIRDVGRVLNLPLQEVDKIAKLVPSTPDAKLDEAVENVKELKTLYTQDPKVKKLIDTAKKLEGLSRHASVHAAGVVISQKPLFNYVPLQKSGDDQIVTQYAMKEIEKIGLLKMDFLGLKNLTMIAKALKLIKELNGVEIDIKKIPLDDIKTYDLLSKGDTLGLFQLEGQGMRNLIKEVQPRKFEEIIDLLALFRPGPLDSGMVDDYIERKKGIKKIVYEIDELKEILGETYGVILYQEQVMQIANKIAGFTMGEADILRYAMGKKNPVEMAKQKDKFISGAVKLGHSKEKAKDLFELCEKFARYGFNKSHSTAYAMISYQTAFLKANYPKEFMAALLSSSVGDTDKINVYISESIRMGIKILPPDINESEKDFMPVKDGIRFALSAIKNVGFGAIDSIIASRKKDGPYKSLRDFANRIDSRLVNKRVLESLIKSGAFDSFGYTRAGLLANYEEVITKNRNSKSKQAVLFSDFEKYSDEIDLGKIKEVEEFPKDQLLRMEKEILGIYISGHPLHSISDFISARASCKASEVSEKMPQEKVVLGGILKNLKKMMTRKNDVMMLAEFEDLSGTVQLVLFPKTYEKYSYLITEDSPVIITGKVDFRRDTPQIIVDSVELVDSSNGKRSLHIKIPPNITHDELNSIKTILTMNRGTESTYLHFGDKIVSASDAYNVTISEELIKNLEQISGPDTVWIEFEEKDQKKEEQND